MQEIISSPKFLKDVLKRDGNNFDILRLVAALAVIIGHAYAISPQPPLQDGVLSILHFDYSGSLAVKFFFFLSGLLVTNSIISNPEPFHFLIKRACRIFPGLIVCLLVTVFIVGPLFTKLPLREYFSDYDVWNYLRKNSLLYDIQWRLPGVFTASKEGINGSLWTLPFEATCYIYLAIFYGLGLLKNRVFSNLFFIGIIAVALISPEHLPPFLAKNEGSHLLVACFSTGALFANNKTLVSIDITRVILIWLLAILLKDSSIFQYIFYLSFFYTSLFIASLPPVIKYLKIPFDASYGVYVYGFVIQQCVNAVLPGIGVHGNQLVSAIVAVIIGILSWYFVEKKFIAFGNQLSKMDWVALVKSTGNNILKAGLNGLRKIKAFLGETVIGFFILVVVALLVHAIVLKFVFPGYYNPLYSSYPELYLPAAIAHSPGGFTDLLLRPHPVSLFFIKFTGYFGIQGSMAWVIALLSANCALTGILINRIFKLRFGWKLVAVFAVYCYLLFSQPYFYTFYIQNTPAQLSYLFLITGACFFYSMVEDRPNLANSLLFGCCLLGFFSSITYGLAALSFSVLWFMHYRKVSYFRAALPFTMVAITLIMAVIDTVAAKPAIIDVSGPVNATTYINLNIKAVLYEWGLYAIESVNIANLVLLLFVAGLFFYMANGSNRKLLLYIVGGCLIGGIVSWIPATVFSGQHDRGYSFDGAYFLYCPLLLLPVLWTGKEFRRGVLIVIAILCLISPLLNSSKYKDNEQAISREETQRNLLGALGPLMKDLNTAGAPQNILVEGITSFPHPFAFPWSLRAFHNAGRASFDVMQQPDSPVRAERVDFVKFIKPSDSLSNKYDQKWVFDKNGKLVDKINLAGERLFTGLDTTSSITINQADIANYETTGFYDTENAMRWTNGKASIRLKNVIQNRDSLFVQLNTFMPDICKAIAPQILLYDAGDVEHRPALSMRKEDVFYYLFIVNKHCAIQRIKMVAETIDASPDLRILSFPFKRLEIKNGHS